MKISVEQSILLAALKRIDAIVNPKSNLPVLQCASIEADESGVCTLRGSDYETTIRDIIQVDVHEHGRALVPCKKLRQTIESLADGQVQLEIEDNIANITCDGATFRLSTQTHESAIWDDFPQWKDVEPELSFTVLGDDLARLAAQIEYAIPVNDPRKILGGFNLAVKDNLLSITTASSGGGAQATIPVPEVLGDTDISSVIPLKTLHQVYINAYDVVSIGLSENRASFAFGDTVYQCVLIDGIYPNFDMVIPKEINHTIVMDKKELFSEIKRSAVVCEDTYCSVRMTASKNAIKINARSPMLGQYENEVDGDFPDIGESVVFNGKLLGETLSAIPSDTIEMHINTPRSPVVFKAPDAPDVLWLLMPIRMSED